MHLRNGGVQDQCVHSRGVSKPRSASAPCALGASPSHEPRPVLGVVHFLGSYYQWLTNILQTAAARLLQSESIS